MKTNETMTPEQFVEKWLPDFDKRLSAAKVHFCECFNYELEPDAGLYANFHCGHFPEALESFRAEVWREACEAQRIECAQSLIGFGDAQGFNSVFDHIAEGMLNAVENTEIPKMPKTSEIPKNRR